MTARPHFSDNVRRARLARRHAISPDFRTDQATAAVSAMTVLHATEAATVYLSIAARTDGVGITDIDRDLYERRCLVKQLAMRRTLFVFPVDLLAAAWAAPSARVAGAEARRVAKAVVGAGLTTDGHAWLERACTEVLHELAARGPLTTAQVRARLPHLASGVTVAPDATSGVEALVTTWVLTQLGLRADAVRGPRTSHWRQNGNAWTPMASWLPAIPDPLTPAQGYAELVRRWLRTFGPATATDAQWWLGATKGAVTTALADIGAVQVDLDTGQVGWVLPDDPGLESVEPDVEPWAALLPVLDPTTMGWRERDFYLPPQHVPFLFDRNGNAGTTAWWNGRIVGCWFQDDDGAVDLSLLERLPDNALAALRHEADRLTAWLGGVRISNVYASPQMRLARDPGASRRQPTGNARSQ